MSTITVLPPLLSNRIKVSKGEYIVVCHPINVFQPIASTTRPTIVSISIGCSCGRFYSGDTDNEEVWWITEYHYLKKYKLNAGSSLKAGQNHLLAMHIIKG
jgi:hypothetical protein